MEKPYQAGAAGDATGAALLPAVELETGPEPRGAVIWLHGLGADGHDFEPAVPALVAPGLPGLRFVFPHAPVRAVSLNAGARMRAWYDIRGLDRHAAQDEIGVRASDAAIRALIRRENERGIPTRRIVLAGSLGWCSECKGGLSAVAAQHRVPSYHYRAVKLGVTMKKTGDAGDFSNTKIGRWLIDVLGIEIEVENRAAILIALNLLAAESSDSELYEAAA